MQESQQLLHWVCVVMAQGGIHRHCSSGSGGHQSSASPAFHWQVPLSLTEVAAELFFFPTGFIVVGFWAKGDELRFGRVGVSSRTEGLLLHWGWLTHQVFIKCRMVLDRPAGISRICQDRILGFGLSCGSSSAKLQRSQLAGEGVLADLLPRNGVAEVGRMQWGLRDVIWCVSGSLVHAAKGCLGMLPAPFPSPCPLQLCFQTQGVSSNIKECKNSAPVRPGVTW